jgi:hypothetical protein
LFIPPVRFNKPNTSAIPSLLEAGEVALAMLQIGFNNKILTTRRLLFMDSSDSKIKEFISIANIDRFVFGSTAGVPRVDALMNDGSSIKIGTLDEKWLEQARLVFESALSDTQPSLSDAETKADASEGLSLSESNSEPVDVEEGRIRTNSLKTFPNWLQKSIDNHKLSDEKLLMVITEPYTNHQGALLVFRDRCMIVKGGLMGGFMAGSLGGERAGTFYFTQITGIEYNSGLINGVLEILTPSYQGTANKDFWRGSTKSRNADSNDPWTLSNCLPLTKDGYKSAKEMIDELKQLVAEAQRPATAAQISPPGLSEELGRLGELLKQGILTEEEFTQAKKNLLNL